jgi:hypothetical protein
VLTKKAVVRNGWYYFPKSETYISLQQSGKIKKAMGFFLKNGN